MTTILPPDQSAPADEPDPKHTAATQDAALTSEETDLGGATRKQVRREQLAVLYKSPGFIIGALMLGFWILASIFPGLLTTIDPKAIDGALRATPNADAWFGTDPLGRDVYSRVIFGARPIMIVAPLATIFAVMAGTLLGLASGYFCLLYTSPSPRD